MSFHIVFSEFALESFADIKTQINTRWGYAVVMEFEQRTAKVLAIIQNSPFIYKSVSSDPNVRKAFIHRNCSMFYQIKDDNVSILFFWDNRQDAIF